MKGKKIDAMHNLFGYGDGKCGTCSHFRRWNYRGEVLQKCDVYGTTNSAATDWAQRYDGCGLYNRPYNGDVPVVEMTTRASGGDEQVDGQMTLFDLT